MSHTNKLFKVIRYDMPEPGLDLADERVKERLVSETEYDARWGKVIRDRQYGSDGQLEQETEYAYDDQGFLVREVLREGDGEVMEEKSWEADEQGRIARQFLHYADGSKDTIEHEYNADGQLIKKVTMDEDGEVEETEVFVYDSGRLVQESLYDGMVEYDELADMEPLREVFYRHDEEGLLLETHERNLMEEVERKRVNHYDEDGYRTEVLVYDENEELIERIQLTPDQKGRPLEVTEETRRMKNTIRMRYNEHGLVDFQEEHDLKGRLVSRVERIYDESGRLLESRVEQNNPAVNVSQYYVVKQIYGS